MSQSISAVNPETFARPYSNRSWEDAYREQYTWDKAVKVTHLRVNCNNACSYVAFVKDGKVIREEQAGTHIQEFPDVPDFNPRGCTPGCIYSKQMYDPNRLQYPMKQVGGRGSGKWERLSWEQALSEIAGKLLDIIDEHGPETLMVATAPNLDFGIGGPMEGHLFGSGLGASGIDIQSEVGDLPVGLIQTWGAYMMEGTSDDWFLSDYILMWIGNPAYTRPSDVHFMYEARYRGAKIVAINPDYNPSTMHADRWLNVRYGTDAALALGMLNVIIEEGLYKPEYIKEQTDLPFLVRTDTERFLRQSDVEEDGADDIFYFFNTPTGRRREAPGTWGSDEHTLELEEDEDPALEGKHRIRLKDGRRVTVETVFEKLKRRVAEYSLDRVSDITGLHPNNIRQVAREYASAKSAMIYSSWGGCKHYHSDLFQRGMAYLCALTGNSGGKPGSGIRVGALWPPPFTALMMGSPDGVTLNTQPQQGMPVDRLDMQQMAKMQAPAGGKGPGSTLVPWLWTHSEKWRDIASKQEYNDPSLKRPVSEYMDDIINNGWQPVTPPAGTKPRFYYVSGTNVLRRWPNARLIRDTIWADLDLAVTCDTKWSTTGQWSDYVLPAAGWYEKPGIKYTMAYTPDIVVGDRAVEPLYESKHEWDMMLMLAEEIQKEARKRGMEPYTDSFGRKFDPANLYDKMTANGTYLPGPEGEEKALDYIMQNSMATRANKLGEGAWRKAAEAGKVKIEAMQPSTLFGGIYSDFTNERPMYSCSWFIEQKNPWPTLTGRQQFYIDHEWFLEIGEGLLTHKDVLPAGGKFPLRLSGGHNRWSQHSVNRTNESLLRLQRGEPAAFISEEDAAERGISDHDTIRVFNEVGSFELRAMVSPSTAPGMVIVYHAWEGFQFKDWATQNDVDANPPKPTNMIGDYGHLYHRGGSYTMNHIPKEVAVDIERVE